MPNTTNQVVPDPQEPNVSRPSSPASKSTQQPLTPKGTPAIWGVLLAIDTRPPQYLALEVTGQLAIGCADPANNEPLGLDLRPFGADKLNVAGRHAVLHAAHAGLHIRDLGSPGGTKLNGRPLDSNKLYKVQQGDVLEFGQMRIALESVRPSAATPATNDWRFAPQRDTPKASSNAVRRAIDYLRNLPNKEEALLCHVSETGALQMPVVPPPGAVPPLPPTVPQPPAPV